MYKEKNDRNTIKIITTIEIRIDGKNGKEPLKGLCKTCSIRETCNLPKPKGGVWHCKYYC